MACGLAASALAQVPPPRLLMEPVWAEIDPRLKPEAERAYRRADANPDNADAVGAFGMMMQAIGRYKEAEAAYRRTLTLDSRAFRIAYYLGVVLQEGNRGSEAIEVIEAALAERENCPPCWSRLGDLERGVGDPDAAEQRYRRALSFEPELASARYGLGRVHAARGEWQEAAAEYELSCQAAKNYGAAYYALGQAYRKLGDKEKAARALRRFERLRPLPEPSFDPLMDALSALRGERAASSGGGATQTLTREQSETLIAELERTLGGNPDSLSAHVNLITLYGELGDTAKAEAHFRQAVKIDANHAGAYYNWGRLQMARGETVAAGGLFEQALAADAEHVETLVQSGLLLERGGDAEEAERRYRRALAVDPLQRQANYLLARRLARVKRFAEAAEHLEETIRVEDSLTPSYMRVLAFSYNGAGDREKAIYYFREARARAVELGLDDLSKNLARDLEKLGEAVE